LKRAGSDDSLRCSFCHKSQDVVGKLISSPSDYPRAYICDECIAVCNSIIEDDRHEKSYGSPGKLPRPLELKEYLDQYVIGQEATKKKLAVALKGASEDLKNHFFKCMSSRAVEMLKEDMEVLGPIRSREVNTAQQEAVTVARQLESEGKIVLKTEQEESYVV